MSNGTQTYQGSVQAGKVWLYNSQYLNKQAKNVNKPKPNVPSSAFFFVSFNHHLQTISKGLIIGAWVARQKFSILGNFLFTVLLKTNPKLFPNSPCTVSVRILHS